MSKKRSFQVEWESDEKTPGAGDEKNDFAELLASTPFSAERQPREVVEEDVQESPFRQAFNDGEAIKGKVTATNKGGFEVELAGTRGFCPFSQMDLPGNRDEPEKHVGQTYPFMISQLKGRDVLLSRIPILREQRDLEKTKFLNELKEGQTVSGQVTKLMPFGAFVQLCPGVEGLIHISEMSAVKRVLKPSDVVNPGNQVEVKILKIIHSEKKISLSLKALQNEAVDPDALSTWQGKTSGQSKNIFEQAFQKARGNK